MAMPMEKKRVLPDWMLKAADTPTKVTPKKPAASAASKKKPGEISL